MKILALDTSTPACSVALLTESEARIRHEVVPMQHANYILSYIEETLGSQLESLDALAWGCGPGGFTGLRIAASVVQALGFARQLPVINVSSLAALAQTAYLERGWKRLLVAMDARMNEVYWGAYQINEEGYAEALGEEGLCSPRELSMLMKKNNDNSDTWSAVGNAWSVYKTELASCSEFNLKHSDPDCLPKALAVAQLGRLKYKKEKGSWHSFDALPTYLRDNVCQKKAS